MANYVNDYEFRNEIRDYYKTPKGTPVPECIGRKLVLISYNFAKRPRYTKSPILDIMISQGIEQMHWCLYERRYKINGEMSPFAFFTKQCHYGFLEAIRNEKKHQNKRVYLDEEL